MRIQLSDKTKTPNITYHGKEIRYWLLVPECQMLMTNEVCTKDQKAVMYLHLTSKWPKQSMPLKLRPYGAIQICLRL